MPTPRQSTMTDGVAAEIYILKYRLHMDIRGTLSRHKYLCNHYKHESHVFTLLRTRCTAAAESPSGAKSTVKVSPRRENEKL